MKEDTSTYSTYMCIYAHTLTHTHTALHNACSFPLLTLEDFFCFSVQCADSRDFQLICLTPTHTTKAWGSGFKPHVPKFWKNISNRIKTITRQCFHRILSFFFHKRETKKNKKQSHNTCHRAHKDSCLLGVDT